MMPESETSTIPILLSPDKLSGQNAPTLSPIVTAYFDKIAITSPVNDLFRTMCPYFDGRHHFEEIMFCENVSRSDLRTVLNAYNDVAVCCLHE